MKKIIFFLLAFFIAVSSIEAQTAEEQLVASNIMLEKALDKIEKLEAEKADLKDKLEKVTERLQETTVQLADSNLVLERAYQRIEKDEAEIARLRKDLEKANKILYSTMDYYTVYGFPTYTLTEGFGAGLAFNLKIAKVPFSIISGIDVGFTDFKFSVFAGIGYTF